MKKKFLFVALAGFAIAITIINKSETGAEQVYLNNINNITKASQLAGPEKSVYRDVLMSMNPKTGELTPRNIQDFFESKRFGRISSEDFQWTQIDTEIAGRVRSIMVDPNDGQKLWAGAVTGGLWYNPDFRNGADWVPVSDDWENMSISCITSDVNDPQTFYVGTGESYTSVSIYRESSSVGAGIYKSTDGGVNWTLLSSTEGFSYVNDIVVRDEEGVSVVYVGVASGSYQGDVFGSSPSDGVFRSDDGGVTWTQVLPNIESLGVPFAVSDIELTPSGTLYVGTMRNIALLGGGKILSSDDGINWTVEDDGYADAIVEEGSTQYGLNLAPGRVRLTSANDVVYATLTSGWVNSVGHIRDHGIFTRLYAKRSGIWESFNGPDFWTSIPWHALAIKVDPNNSNRLAIGGLDVHAVSDATATDGLSWIQASDWVAMYHFSDYTRELFFGTIDQPYSDSIISHFVHADIHDILFVGGSSDEVLIANDGGVNYADDFSKTYAIPTGDRLDDYSFFKHINNSFASTQYYTVALHPDAGNNEILAGSQDNSTHTNEETHIGYANMIGGGDGAYCFFDSDNPELRITSSQQSNYNMFIGDEEYNYGLGGGSFINPAAYDDRSNLLYSNMAVDGGFEILSPGLQGRFLDTLAILNVNKFLHEDDLGLDTLSFINIGTNSTAAFSALKLSPHDPANDATLVMGNQLGDVYIVTGLPGNPVGQKIDNNDLPVGYISSVDIGDTNNDILVTFSNYGIQSVWYTSNGGGQWVNLERNLPDIPVRHGIFNPLDDQKLMIATEAGIWGLENILDENEEWVSYSNGFPNVRVDMIQARGSDSVIVAATHGRGLFLGKFTQGTLIEEPLSAELAQENVSVYPNPTFGTLNVDQSVDLVEVYSLNGTLITSAKTLDSSIDLSGLNPGMYVVVTTDNKAIKTSYKVLKK